MKSSNRIRTVRKTTGEVVAFSEDKLTRSLVRSGASKTQAQTIVARILPMLEEDTTTQQIYKRAFALLRKEQGYMASKYKLKKALFELGPTGFPFEIFIGEVLSHMGYNTQVGVQLQGHCVTHEVDVLALKEGHVSMVECKFHSDQSRTCDVKIPLYIKARFDDLTASGIHHQPGDITEGWVVTNTRFTKDAEQYGTCVGLRLLSWDFPKGNSLKDIIEQFGLASPNL